MGAARRGSSRSPIGAVRFGSVEMGQSEMESGPTSSQGAFGSEEPSDRGASRSAAVLAERNVQIVNTAGLHARPCHAIVSLALGYQSQLTVGNGQRQVNGRSILELISLNAPCDSRLWLRAEGDDAEALVGALAKLIESGFDETD